MRDPLPRLPLPAAVMGACGFVLGGALLARTWGPEPQHPRTTAWYAALRKPPFTPPGWVIGGAWMTLEALLAVAGTRLLAAPPDPARVRALAGWAVAVSGIPGWMAVFFGARRVAGGLAVIGLMLGAASTAIAAARQVDRVAASAMAPLLGWLGFAGLLNAEVWRRNRLSRF